MNRRKTLGELRWPDSPEFSTVAESFKKGCTDKMMAFVWKAYDSIRDVVLTKVDVNAALDDLERSITQYLEPEIHQMMDDGLPFYVQHGTFEHETRLAPPAQPPAYDIAFVLYSNRRVMWPIEAKVLRTDGEVGKYVKDLVHEFLTCRYAPFSTGGAMIGYLLSGDPQKAFANIATKVPCTLAVSPPFKKRWHRTSDHIRTIPNQKDYPATFRCHHLLFSLNVKSEAA